LEYEIEFLEMVDFFAELAVFEDDMLYYKGLHPGMWRDVVSIVRGMIPMLWVGMQLVTLMP